MINLFKKIASFPILDNFFIFIISRLLIFPFFKKKLSLNEISSIQNSILNLDPTLDLKQDNYFKTFDPISKKNIPIKHYKFINFSTKSTKRSEEVGDFIIPACIHKHGWLLSEIIRKEKNNDKSYEKIYLNLIKWRKIFPIGHGVPYIVSLSIAQRLIHWSLSGFILLSNQKSNFKLKNKLYKTILKFLVSELSYLIIRSTIFASKKNNFFVADSVAFLLAYELLKKEYFLTPLFKLLIDHIRVYLKKYLKNTISISGETDEGSLHYSQYILESLAILDFLNINFYHDETEPLFNYLNSISDKSLKIPNFGDTSLESALSIYSDKDIGNLKKDILRNYFKNISNFGNTLNRNSLRRKYNLFINDSKICLFEQSTTIYTPNYYLHLDHENIPNKKYNGGHAHQDIGSFILNSNNNEIFVSTGTFSYNYKDLRDQFRSSELHNSINIPTHNYGILKERFKIINLPNISYERLVDDNKFKIKLKINKLSKKNDNKIDDDLYISRIFEGDIKSKSIKLNDSLYSSSSLDKENLFSSHFHLNNNIKPIFESFKNIINLFDNKNNLVCKIKLNQYEKFFIKDYKYSPKYGELINSKKIIIFNYFDKPIDLLISLI